MNGLCSSGTNGTGCVCNEGFTGLYCETKRDYSMIISLSVIIPSVVLISLGIFLYLFCGRKPVIDISILPEEIRWYFDTERILTESGWVEDKGFIYKNVMEDKKYLKRLTSLMTLLDGGTLEWQCAYVIFNQNLQNNFLGYRNVTLSRHNDSPYLFKKNYPQKEQRDWVMEQYKNLVGRYEWNVNLELPILPVIHGTSEKVAKSICSTGFASLSSLDAGFYGKGIYTTSSCLYALPYYATKTKPTILICLVTPGNVYPVIENATESSGLMGKVIQNGFQSHFVITAKSGKIAIDRDQKFYDEFVMPTESQLVPIYMISMEKSYLDELISEFKREIPH
uniref:EGF-like domain-containing protein n=1 Tax=Arcella intermedia TaxID=1963864 RepID=A0A6B2L501_9EUKA